MRIPLQKFTDFAHTLLPHETRYLINNQQFEDSERVAILERIDYNCTHIDQFTPFDQKIDKRKYNHLKRWINERLAKIDVDQQHSWILDTEHQVTTDAIQPNTEKVLLQAIKSYSYPSFYFTRFYELVEHYRHFLQIRMRYVDYQLVDEFITHYEAQYLRSKDCYARMHLITKDVIAQYRNGKGESLHWYGQLEEIFCDEAMDGFNRYHAFVRMIFIAFNYNIHDRMLPHFDYLDKVFAQGKIYAKRILVNYYGNRLLLHSQLKDYKTALYYGRLSVRTHNHDYLFYINNLAAVLLRMAKPQEALQLLKSAAPTAKSTANMHSRIGYVAFFLEAQLKNGLFKHAENYGDTFLRAYTKEILKYRWHLFFTIYLTSVLIQNHSHKAIKIIEKYKLQEKDSRYQSKANYLPAIPMLLAIAQHLEGDLSEKELKFKLSELIDASGQDVNTQKRFTQFLRDLIYFFPMLKPLIQR